MILKTNKCSICSRHVLARRRLRRKWVSVPLTLSGRMREKQKERRPAAPAPPCVALAMGVVEQLRIF